MKIFFIILLSILVGVSFGIGYFVYKNNRLINKPISEQNIIATEPKTFDYQPSSTSSQIQQNQSKNVKQLNISQDYLMYYQNSINYLNQISNSLKNLQQTLIEIEKKYNDKNYLALPRLVSKASDENSNFIQTVSNLKNSFDNWSIANKNSVDELSKSKTNQVVEIGLNYTQSSLNFSKAVDEILAYKGIGDLNQLSKEFQEATQKMEIDGKNLNILFSELNNILTL